MPRGARSKPGQSSSSASSDDGWLQAAEAENTLRRLCGQWRDQMGSNYQLRLDKEGVLELRTTRPRGKTMRTRGLIRIEWSGDYGRVVWGRPGARTVFTIGKLDDNSLVWQSGSSKPFNWDRVEEAGEEEDVEEGKEGKDQAEGAWADGAWSTRKWSDEKWSNDGWAGCDRDWDEEEWNSTSWTKDVGDDQSEKDSDAATVLPDGWHESQDAGTGDSTQLEAKPHPWRKAPLGYYVSSPTTTCTWNQDGRRESEKAGRAGCKQPETKSHPWHKVVDEPVSGQHQPGAKGATGREQRSSSSSERAISDPAVITEVLRCIIGISGGCKNEQADADYPGGPRRGPWK